MAQAFGVASKCDDAVAARMAFLESYRALCQQSRDNGVPVKWTPCLGHDKHGRDGPLLDAVATGKLATTHVGTLLIGESAHADMLRIAQGVIDKQKQLPDNHDGT
jgi:hypothetical protein